MKLFPQLKYLFLTSRFLEREKLLPTYMPSFDFENLKFCLYGLPCLSSVPLHCIGLAVPVRFNLFAVPVLCFVLIKILQDSALLDTDPGLATMKL
jgi:hypothetical protein